MTDWLAATRASYDTLAAAYTDAWRGLHDRSPYDRAVLALFADLVRDAGGGAVLDVGCGPGRLTGRLAAAGLDVSGVRPAVDLRFHLRRPDAVASLLDTAGFDVLMTSERAPLAAEGETTGQCYLLAARRPG